MTNNKSNTNLKPKIKSAFRQAGGDVTRKDIGKAIRLRREDRPEFDRIIAAMIARGELREKEDKLMLAEKPDTLVKAVVVKVNPTFGFAKPDEAEEDVFIAGRRMMGAMPGDTVLLRLRKDRNGRTEGEVTKIVEEAPFIFTGVVQRNGGFLDVMPDKGARFPIGVYKDDGLKPKEGHKVRCELIRGGSSHFDHKAMVLEDFGDAELAKNCTAAIIAASGAPTEFSAEALAEAAAIDKAGIHEKLVDIAQTRRLLVDVVLALAAAVVAPGHGHLGLLHGGEDVGAVVDDQRHLGEARLGPLGGTAEDDVLHLGAPEALGALLAHDPADGVGDIGLAGAVWPHDGRDVLTEVQHRLIREALEALDFQSPKVHESLTSFMFAYNN